MAIRKLEAGQFHKLPFSEIKLKPLPKLKEAFQTYYENGDFLLDALSPTKAYSKAYLNTTYVTVVQNPENLSEFFLIGGFEVLHIIDRYPPKDLAHKSVQCLVCNMPNDDRLTTLVEAQLMHAKLGTRAIQQAKATFHTLLKIVHAAVNDNETDTEQARLPVDPEPLPDLGRAINSNTQEHKEDQLEIFGESHEKQR